MTQEFLFVEPGANKNSCRARKYRAAIFGILSLTQPRT